MFPSKGVTQKHIFPPKGVTRKLSVPLTSHWAQPSHVAPANCSGSWEMFSLAGKQSGQTSILMLWRLKRKLAEPAIST